MGQATALELKKLYEAALDFKQSNLWENMDYARFFILHDPETDLEVFCHVLLLENGGTALSVYLGEEGLEAFRYIFEETQLSHLDHVVLKGNLRRHCLTVSFSDKNYLIKDDIEHAMKAGHFFAEIEDHPIFNYSHPDHQLVPVTLTDPWHCRLMTRALVQAVEVMVLVKTQHLELPTLESPLYYLRYEVQGNWEGNFVSASLYTKKPEIRHETLFLNDLAAYRIKKQPTLPLTLEGIQFYIPQPVAQIGTEESFYMLITALVDSEAGQIYFLDIQEKKDMDGPQILNDFAKQLLELEVKPHYIVAEDERLFLLLKDFCKKADIKLRLNHHVMKAHEFVDYLLNEIAQSNLEGDGSEVEELLNFVEEISQLMENRNELAGLRETERKNYQLIVQTFVLGMYTVRQQTILEWDADAFKEICETIVPEQFEGELLEAAHGVMKHFVTMMGEEELISDYRRILNVVDVLL